MAAVVKRPVGHERASKLHIHLQCHGLSQSECLSKIKSAIPEANMVIVEAVNQYSQPGLFEPSRPLSAIDGCRPPRAMAPPVKEQLSERQEEILRYVAKGFINKEIAEVLSITLETVRTHLKNIFVKLNARSRTEAVVKYFQRDTR